LRLGSILGTFGGASLSSDVRPESLVNLKLTVEEVEARLHPLSPRLSTSHLSRLSYDIEGQHVASATVTVATDAGRERSFLFEGVWANGGPGALAVPYPLDSGILIVDLRHRGWERPFIVIADDDEFTLLFGASDVYEVA
jgi:hypothetical protein